MNCALILAGGMGSRLYPLSTEEIPKQFVPIYNNKTLLEETYERVSKFIKKEDIYIICPLKYKKYINILLKDVQNKNIIIEPSARNTSPAILYALLYFKNKYDNVFTFPSDHHIGNKEAFLNAMKLAIKSNHNKEIIIMGAKVTYPSTQYGYIKPSCNKNVSLIEDFIEKPNLKLATKFYEDGSYLWNTAMMFFNINHVINLYKKYLPKDLLLLLDNSLINYDQCTKINFERSIINKEDKNLVIVSDMDWDDLGSFESLLRRVNNKEDYHKIIDALKLRYLMDKK